MSFSNRFKHYLRRFSARLVIFTNWYVILNRKNYSDDELLPKLKHFYRCESDARFVVGRAILKGPHVQKSRSLNAVESFFVKLFVILTGKILVLSDHWFWLNLQKALYFKVFVVDFKGYYRNSSWRFHCSSYDKKSIDLNLANSKPLHVSGDSVVLMGTGPSAPLIFSDFFQGLPVITCNTAIKSPRLLQLNIVAHCFSDATFMLGSGAYSQAFLDALTHATKQKRFPLVYDLEAHNFVRKYFSHVPKEDLWPVFLSVDLPIQHRFGERRQQRMISNVATNLMLPFAATYFKTIYCVGFDGKGTTQNYFWKHNDEFQFTDLLPTVRQVDPAKLKDMNYDQYSTEHEENLVKILNQAENDGIKIVMCHPSSIAPLRERFDAEIFAKVQSGVRSEDFVLGVAKT